MRSRSEVARDHETKSEKKIPCQLLLRTVRRGAKALGRGLEHSARRPLTGISSPKATGTRPDASF